MGRWIVIVLATAFTCGIAGSHFPALHNPLYMLIAAVVATLTFDKLTGG